MINFYNQVPSVYTKASRDFQYLSWLINIVLNSVKHNVDDIYDLPVTKADPRLIELLALTLGFKVRRNYDVDQLTALVKVLPSLLKCKGSLKAIKIAGKVLVAASGAGGDFSCEVKDGLLEVVLPKTLVDITLFMDLLPYILPAGMTCRVVRKTQEEHSLETILNSRDNLQAWWFKEMEWDAEQQKVVGLTGLFESGDLGKSESDLEEARKTPPVFTNFKTPTELELNTGLLDNSIIPTLEEPLISWPEKESEE